jgi:hypothetical protein
MISNLNIVRLIVEFTWGRYKASVGYVGGQPLRGFLAFAHCYVGCVQIVHGDRVRSGSPAGS